ncbi:hypothetical protein FNW52_03680 [Flavobacterium sp. ZT3R18]|uniref:hypothetical protein n=1 Tax=Flavobacterium sp. ZT3R18 TaxID=2594429 RepID=UPI00117A6123|nr:hypothetical protein [Flavobacterium sp. ZT3R18]TRX38012.1 hypothetical protein FNW52_03680 [Flavobacterium sp. ZT3R18]
MKKNKYLALVGIIVITTLSFFSCKKNLSENQKVFLDFAKAEDTYSGGGYYYNLDLHSNYDQEPIYYDSIFNISKLKKELQDSLQLLEKEGGGYIIDYSKTSTPIQYPHKFSFKKIKSNSYNVKLSIFIPDGYEHFSLGKEDIGEKLSKNGMNITLLDIRNDAATLLIENTAEKMDYSYTYGIRANEEDNNIAKGAPIAYSNCLFSEEWIEKPNLQSKRRNENNNDVLQFDFSRLNMSLVDHDGRTIQSEGRIIDFRHYLWYRNHDMPYPEMKSSYLDLQRRYKEGDKNPNHRYNGISVVNVRGLGKIKKLDFFLRSNKGHIEVIDFGEIFLQKNKEKEDNETQDFSQYKTYTNLNDSIVKKLLKIDIAALVQTNSHLLYASLPLKYSESLGFSFDDMYLKTDKNDSIKITDYEKTSIINRIGNFESTNNKGITIESVDPKYTYVSGKVGINRPVYEDKKFTINNLPNGFIYNKENNTLEIEYEMYYYENEIYGFENLNSKKTIPIYLESNSNQIVYKFKMTPSHIIIREKKSANDIEIPFKLKIPKKQYYINTYNKT